MAERWIPMYINTVIANRSHQKIDADYWNALWNLVITQADHNTAGVEYIMGEFEIFKDTIAEFTELMDGMFDMLNVDDDITTSEIPGSGISQGEVTSGDISYSEDSLIVTFDGQEYSLPKNETPNGIVYGEVDSSGNPIFDTYPFAISFEPSEDGVSVILYTPDSGEHHVSFDIPTSDRIKEDVLPEVYDDLFDENGNIVESKLPTVYENLFDSNGKIKRERLPAGSAGTDPYPVGSIYISTSSTNPSTYFVGTWQQIKDVFLVATGDSQSELFGLAADADISANSLKVYMWKRTA